MLHGKPLTLNVDDIRKVELVSGSSKAVLLTIDQGEDEEIRLRGEVWSDFSNDGDLKARSTVIGKSKPLSRLLKKLFSRQSLRMLDIPSSIFVGTLIVALLVLWPLLSTGLHCSGRSYEMFHAVFCLLSVYVLAPLAMFIYYFMRKFKGYRERFIHRTVLILMIAVQISGLALIPVTFISDKKTQITDMLKQASNECVFGSTPSIARK